MFDDEVQPKVVQGGVPRDLEPMSVTEMEAYLIQLDEEKLRVRQEIDRRGAARAGADAVFKM